MDLEKEIPEAYSTGDLTSFAFTSAQSRWPSILTNAIDDLHRTLFTISDSTDSEGKIAEGKSILRSLASLKYGVQHNRQITPLSDDGKPDVQSYNAELIARGNPTWHNTQWLYAECYLYRRIATFFNASTHWRTYDVFFRQKMSTFKSSRPAVLELSSRYRDIITQIRNKDAVVDTADPSKAQEAEKVLFTEMCEICLWGNATDLSLLTTLTYEDIQKLQGSSARKESEKNILVNDLPRAFDLLNQLKQSSKTDQDRRVDIVLDNAGFELFVDLILAGYLLATNLATEVVLHPKDIPWFVSDVVPKDLAALLNAMSDPRTFYETMDDDQKHADDPESKPPPLSPEEVENVKFLFDDWSALHSEGELILRPNAFWTQAGSFWRMPSTAPELYADLQQSELIIFKGDLNYRKLTGDVSPFPL